MRGINTQESESDVHQCLFVTVEPQLAAERGGEGKKTTEKLAIKGVPAVPHLHSRLREAQLEHRPSVSNLLQQRKKLKIEKPRLTLLF